MLGRFKFNLDPIIKNVHDRYSPDVWSSDSTTFLDTDMGGGQWLLDVVARLREAGHSDYNIQQRVFGLCELQVDLNYVRNKYKDRLLGTFRVGNFLDEDYIFDQKFDVIESSPDSQAKTSGDRGRWALMVDRAVENTKHGGYVSMVIPTGWMSPTTDIRKGRKSVLRDIFAKCDTTYINIDPKLKDCFPGVGNNFSYFILRKSVYDGRTIIDTGKEEVIVDLRDYRFIPLNPNHTTLSIARKITSGYKKWETITKQFSCGKWDGVRFEESATYKYPRINGSSNNLDKIAYTKDKCDLQESKKVFLPRRGSHYAFVVDNGKMGVTDGFVILLKENDRIDSAKTYFSSPLIKWLGHNKMKYTQFCEGAMLNCVGDMNLTRPITWEDIANRYNLTKSEVAYLEKYN